MKEKTGGFLVENPLFIRKEKHGQTFWELQIETKTPCTEEEKKIYGVEFKIDPDQKKPYILELNFADGGKFYRIFSGVYYTSFGNPNFKKLDEAKKFLIKEFL